MGGTLTSAVATVGSAVVSTACSCSMVRPARGAPPSALGRFSGRSTSEYGYDICRGVAAQEGLTGSDEARSKPDGASALGRGVRKVAAAAQVSPDTVARLERGETLYPRTVAVICVALEAGVEFIEENGSAPGVRYGKPHHEPLATWKCRRLRWPGRSTARARLLHAPARRC